MSSYDQRQSDQEFALSLPATPYIGRKNGSMSDIWQHVAPQHGDLANNDAANMEFRGSPRSSGASIFNCEPDLSAGVVANTVFRTPGRKTFQKQQNLLQTQHGDGENATNSFFSSDAEKHSFDTQNMYKMDQASLSEALRQHLNHNVPAKNTFIASAEKSNFLTNEKESSYKMSDQQIDKFVEPNDQNNNVLSLSYDEIQQLRKKSENGQTFEKQFWSSEESDCSEESRRDVESECSDYENTSDLGDGEGDDESEENATKFVKTRSGRRVRGPTALSAPKVTRLSYRSRSRSQRLRHTKGRFSSRRGASGNQSRAKNASRKRTKAPRNKSPLVSAQTSSGVSVGDRAGDATMVGQSNDVRSVVTDGVEDIGSVKEKRELARLDTDLAFRLVSLDEKDLLSAATLRAAQELQKNDNDHADASSKSAKHSIVKILPSLTQSGVFSETSGQGDPDDAADARAFNKKIAQELSQMQVSQVRQDLATFLERHNVSPVRATQSRRSRSRVMVTMKRKKKRRLVDQEGLSDCESDVEQNETLDGLTDEFPTVLSAENNNDGTTGKSTVNKNSSRKRRRSTFQYSDERVKKRALSVFEHQIDEHLQVQCDMFVICLRRFLQNLCSIVDLEKSAKGLDSPICDLAQALVCDARNNSSADKSLFHWVYDELTFSLPANTNHCKESVHNATIGDGAQSSGSTSIKTFDSPAKPKLVDSPAKPKLVGRTRLLLWCKAICRTRNANGIVDNHFVTRNLLFLARFSLELFNCCYEMVVCTGIVWPLSALRKMFNTIAAPRALKIVKDFGQLSRQFEPFLLLCDLHNSDQFRQRFASLCEQFNRLSDEHLSVMRQLLTQPKTLDEDQNNDVDWHNLIQLFDGNDNDLPFAKYLFDLAQKQMETTQDRSMLFKFVTRGELAEKEWLFSYGASVAIELFAQTCFAFRDSMSLRCFFNVEKCTLENNASVAFLTEEATAVQLPVLVSDSDGKLYLYCGKIGGCVQPVWLKQNADKNLVLCEQPPAFSDSKLLVRVMKNAIWTNDSENMAKPIDAIRQVKAEWLSTAALCNIDNPESTAADNNNDMSVHAEMDWNDCCFGIDWCALNNQWSAEYLQKRHLWPTQGCLQAVPEKVDLLSTQRTALKQWLETKNVVVGEKDIVDLSDIIMSTAAAMKQL